MRSAASTPAAPWTATPQAAAASAVSRLRRAAHRSRRRERLRCPRSPAPASPRRTAGPHPRVGHNGPCALEHDDLPLSALRGLGGRAGTAVVVVGVGSAIAGQARELAGMRREHERTAEALPPTGGLGERVQPVRVHDGRHRQRQDELARATVRRLLASEAGTDDDGIVRGGLGRRPPPTTRSDQPRRLLVERNPRELRDHCRQPGDDGVRRRDAHESGAGPHRAEAGQHRGTGYSIDPPMTSTRPKSPLCARSGRGGRFRATQRCVIERTAAATAQV